MKTRKRIEETVTLGGEENAIRLSVDYDEGNHPEDVHVGFPGTDTRHLLSIEAVLRIAELIREKGWHPNAHRICADHGALEKTADYMCPKCRAERAAAEARQAEAH